MPDWIGRLASIAAIAGAGALLTGFVAGAAFAALFLFVFLVVSVALALRARERLAKWLASPSVDDMPDDEGTWGEIYARLHRMLREQSASRASLSHALWRFRQAGEAMPDGVLVLDADDRIRQYVIRQLMCNFRVDKGEVAKRFGIEYPSLRST